MLNQDTTAPRKRRIHAIPTCPAGYIQEVELARRFGKHLLTIQKERARGNCPAYVRIGQSIFYGESAIAAWLAAKEVDPSKPKKLTRRRKA
jgi:hypothetical protein